MVNDESIIRRSPLSIGFASMSNNDNVNESRIIVDGIDHAIVANATIFWKMRLTRAASSSFRADLAKVIA